MKTGRTLEELLAEVVRQKETKRDFVANTAALEMVVGDHDFKPEILIGEDERFGVNEVAHEQIGSHLQIPKQYYERMLATKPDLLVQNVNTWLKEKPEKRMIRTLDGNARAFLSDRYRPLDNTDLLEAALPPLLDMKVEVMSCEVTARRLYVKVVDQRIKRDIKVGKLGEGHERFDTLSPALVLSNSETGSGAVSVQGSVWTGGCTNLMVIREKSVRKYHVGGRHEIGDEVYAMLSDHTRKLTDAALWSQLKDVVVGAFDQAKFDATCEKLEAAALNEIDPRADVGKVIEITAKKFGFNDTEKGSILQHFIKTGNLTQYGLHSAITRAAEDVASYDRASEMERIGGEVIELSKNDFRELAMAA